MPEFPITVVLNQFFLDYRSTSRLFLNNDIHTIKDLIKHISTRFCIDTKFYLTCNNIYLPDDEDIRVIEKDDIICAVVKHEALQHVMNHDLEVEKPQELVKRKKAKKRTKSRNKHLDNTAPNKVIKNTENISISSVDIVPVLDDSVTNKEKKKRKKEVHAYGSDSETVPNTAIHKTKKSCKELENLYQNKESIQSSPQSDNFQSKNLTNGLSPYNYINNFKAPYKRQIKPMEISTIPKVINTIHVCDKSPITLESETNKSKAASPYITDSNTSTPNQTVVDKQLEIECAPRESTNVQETISEKQLLQDKHDRIDSQRTSEKIATTKTESITCATDRLQQAKQSLLQQIREKFENFSQINNISTCSLKSFNSDLEDPETVTEDSNFTYPVKRKRKRVRRKKTVQTSGCSDSEMLTKPFVKEPYLAPSSSGSHVRFEDNSPMVVEDIASANGDSLSEIHSTSVQSIKDVDSDKWLQNQIDNILKYPIIDDTLLPKEGDIIAFKLLVMSQSYTPQISDYIVAHVLSYDSTTKSLFLSILEGAEQCRTPEGKFLLREEAHIQNESDRCELNLEHLLEPRLLYP